MLSLWPSSTKLSDWRCRCDSVVTCLTDKLASSLYILGDFNINLMTEDEFACHMKFEYHLTQVIHKSTRITKSSATLIDHVYCTPVSSILSPRVAEFHLSDHALTYLALANSTFRKKSSSFCLITFHLFSKINEFKLRQDFASKPWLVLDSFEDVDDKVNYFYMIFTGVWDRHATTKSRKCRHPSLPWFTSDVLASMG